MSKTTVENVIGKVRDHFELVMLCSQRAKDLFAGSRPTVERYDDKNTVLAIREIEEDTVKTDELKEEFILSNQVNVPIVLDKSEDDDLLAIEREIKGEIMEELQSVQDAIPTDLAFDGADSFEKNDKDSAQE